jgi:glycogen operon protein
MQAEGGDPNPEAIFAVFNSGPAAALHLPETAPGWELLLDTTAPDQTPTGRPSDLRQVPAQSVLLFRSLTGTPKGGKA